MEKFVNLASLDYFCRGHAGCRAEIGEEEFQVVKRSAKLAILLLLNSGTMK